MGSDSVYGMLMEAERAVRDAVESGGVANLNDLLDPLLKIKEEHRAYECGLFLRGLDERRKEALGHELRNGLDLLYAGISSYAYNR